MTPLNIAVMGAGLIGKRHAEHVLAHAGTTLSAIIDPSDSARTFAENLGARWYRSFADIEPSDRPQGVIIATPNQLHVENALEVIAQGIPALVEKPIADNAAAARDMVTAATRANVPILVGHHRRHNPMIRKAKELLDSGILGQILAVHGVFWVMKPDDYYEVIWRRQEGAGPILVNLIHDIDLFRYLFGEIVTVHALASNAVRHHAVEETCVVTVRFASGVLGTLNVSDSIISPWSWEMTTGENPSFPQQDAFCYQIGGTHGSLSIPQLESGKIRESATGSNLRSEAAYPLSRPIRSTINFSIFAMLSEVLPSLSSAVARVWRHLRSSKPSRRPPLPGRSSIWTALTKPPPHQKA